MLDGPSDALGRSESCTSCSLIPLYDAPAPEAKSVGLVASLVAPERHRAVAVHVGIDPRLDREALIATRNGSVGIAQLDPVVGPVEGQDASVADWQEKGEHAKRDQITESETIFHETILSIL